MQNRGLDYIIDVTIRAVAPTVSEGTAYRVPTVSLKFEDSSTNMESLADNPAILLPLHATAHLTLGAS